MPLLTALEFIGSCLVLGLGVLVASESFLHLRQRVIPATLANAIAGLSGLVTAAVGGYMATMTVRW
jgi:hypothetical protein